MLLFLLSFKKKKRVFTESWTNYSNLKLCMQLRHFLKRVLNVVIQEWMSFWAIIAVCHFGKLKWLAWEWLFGRWILISVGKAATSNNGVLEGQYHTSPGPGQPTRVLATSDTRLSSSWLFCSHCPIRLAASHGLPKAVTEENSGCASSLSRRQRREETELGMDFVLTSLGW